MDSMSINSRIYNLEEDSGLWNIEVFNINYNDNFVYPLRSYFNQDNFTDIYLQDTLEKTEFSSLKKALNFVKEDIGNYTGSVFLISIDSTHYYPISSLDLLLRVESEKDYKFLRLIKNKLEQKRLPLTDFDWRFRSYAGDDFDIFESPCGKEDLRENLKQKFEFKEF